MSSDQTDWEGLPVPENEPDDKEILVWEVSPHFDSTYDVCVERSWQRMLEYVSDGLEEWLERYTVEELLEEPVKLSFRLRKMTVAEWRDM